MSGIEMVATLFGVACVYLVIRRSIWCWPIGLVQVVLYAWIFYDVKLYSDAILQVIYVGLQLWGWYHWLHGGPTRHELPMSSLPARDVFGWILVTLAGTAGWGWLMSQTDAAFPYADACIAVASLVAQWLLTRKVLQNWWFWIAVDILAIAVYSAKELYWTTGLYALFLIMATTGLWVWQRDWNRAEPEVRAVEA